MLPYQYLWLNKEHGPRILREALNLYGTVETPGSGNNPKIMKWAAEVGEHVVDVYNADSIPWCGLFMGVCAKRADFPPPRNMLWALSWSSWGTPVETPMLGDVMVFTRAGGGHVGLYVGEDDDFYHILGGNQQDAVNIRRRAKNSGLYAVRRCPWRVEQPPNVRRVILAPTGVLSGSEA